MTGVSRARWREAQRAEREFWSSLGLGIFRLVVAGAMETADWVQPYVASTGDWLEIGVGPGGIGCIHFLRGGGDLHTLDPIERTAADEWQLPESCKVLLRFCRETATHHVGQAEQLDFRDDTFVLVAMLNALDHVQDPGKVLREVRRVLKPGGHLLLTVDTFSTLGRARYQLTRRKLQDTIFVRAHPHRYSSSDVMQLVAACGFRVARAEIPAPVAAAVGRHRRVRLLAQ